MENLNPRHIAQIVRRKSITKVKPSGKVYSRKKTSNNKKDWGK
jgi:hypothetical protein